MPEEHKVYRLEIPVHFYTEVGLDPERTPERRLALANAMHAALASEALFWTVRQLGNMVEHGGWIYNETDLANALGHIGELGQAMAQASGEIACRLEHMAVESQREVRKGSGSN